MEKTFNHIGQNLTNTKAFEKVRKFPQYWSNSTYYVKQGFLADDRSNLHNKE
jgi:hypothetical protein